MPKQVDHRQRRVEIAVAVCSLVSAHGLEAVSLRDVATEAGVSMGRVQHYFKSKDEMLLFALDYISEQGTARVHDFLAALPDPDEPRAVLRGIAQTLIGTGAEQANRVAMAFQARALVEPRLARHLLQGYEQLQGLVELVIQRAIDSGEIAPATPARVEATALLALSDGLGYQLLLGHGTTERALQVVDSQLDRLFASGPGGP
ncbi:TetR/AcrR family transcriptional regulator [Streptomonospora sp. PA3]|uniref:TetR/AcrR family transcriptional regulator n=1 Tax=Streptomonospora sp. PA3 TaxID=2607326 RepID=UPI0012DE38FA|nr:TetR/AcrR family transcriptional regulator [Streptomonospora sp. PA3]MUL43742.1 TetR/AcrR family transcriptional regulator [Streptomonospora sp. PA3]